MLSRPDSIGLLCAGLSGVALNLDIEHLRQLSTAIFEIGLEHGVSVENMMPWHVPWDGLRKHVYPIHIASEFSAVFQKHGLTVGFLHGHFRLLTPANWTNVLLAREKCDLLILGIEDNWRTKKYKGVDPITKDWQRWQWILGSGFRGCLTRISRVDYSDKGYEGILKKINLQFTLAISISQSQDSKKWQKELQHLVLRILLYLNKAVYTRVSTYKGIELYEFFL